MNEKTMKLLSDYLGRLSDIKSGEALAGLDDMKAAILEDSRDETELALKNKFFDTVMELIGRSEKTSGPADINLSVAEREELEKVKALIDENRFTYFFQPIVRADTGEIYSFEALMRARDHKDVTTFHILKFAEQGNCYQGKRFLF